MSRIGKHPVELASGVSATIADGFITVKGPKGEVKMHILPRIRIDQEGNVLKFVQTEETRESNANVGTMRALVADMNKGVSQGFETKLTLVGVGYRAHRNAQPDGNRHQGRRQAEGWSDGRRHPQLPCSGTLQGQGHPLR